MYEIYGIVYGWNVSKEPAAWIAREYMEHLGGQQPYAGAGEATTYIGIDVDELDADIIYDGLSIDQFNIDIQREFSSKLLLKNNRFAQNIQKWRQDLMSELQNVLNDGEISQDEYDSFEKKIVTKPTLFWTWSTS